MSDTRALATVPPVLSLAEVKTMAQAVAASHLFKGIDSAESAFTLMLLCQAEGLHPIQAMRRYHIVDGQPSMKADAILAEFLARGGTVDWHQYDDEACDATFTGKTTIRVRWDMERARKADLTGKVNWKRYPRQMLRSRAVSEGVRVADPAVVVGIYTPEEIEDLRPDATATVRPVYTPPPAQSKPANDATPAPVVVDVETKSGGGPEKPTQAHAGVIETAQLDPAAVKKLQTLFGKLGIGQREADEQQLDGHPRAAFLRDRRLEKIGEVIGRTITTAKELTAAEAEKACAWAEAEIRGPVVEPDMITAARAKFNVPRDGAA